MIGEGETRKRADEGSEVDERRGGGSASDAKDWEEKLRKEGSCRLEAEGRGGRGRNEGTSGAEGSFGGSRIASPAVERECKSMELVG